MNRLSDRVGRWWPRLLVLAALIEAGVVFHLRPQVIDVYDQIQHHGALPFLTLLREYGPLWTVLPFAVIGTLFLLALVSPQRRMAWLWSAVVAGLCMVVVAEWTVIQYAAPHFDYCRHGSDGGGRCAYRLRVPDGDVLPDLVTDRLMRPEGGDFRGWVDPCPDSPLRDAFSWDWWALRNSRSFLCGDVGNVVIAVLNPPDSAFTRQIVVGLDQNSGEELWRRSLPISHEYVAIPDRGVLAVDAHTVSLLGASSGQDVWKVNYGPDVQIGTTQREVPIVRVDAKGTIFIAANGLLQKVDTGTGAREWSVPVDNKFFAPAGHSIVTVRYRANVIEYEFLDSKDGHSFKTGSIETPLRACVTVETDVRPMDSSEVEVLFTCSRSIP